jgi:hypothetical protein
MEHASNESDLSDETLRLLYWVKLSINLFPELEKSSFKSEVIEVFSLDLLIESRKNLIFLLNYLLTSELEQPLI